MTINDDTYGSSLLAHVGVGNVFGDEPERYPTTDLEQVRARRPDVVLAPSEPFPFAERHRPELDVVAPTILVDGQDLFWWGTRTAGALERFKDLADRAR
jgi:ABC-type Fe3+-hydroxamate transport system substrate-binding protein